MTKSLKTLIFGILLFPYTNITAQINQAKVYWVGHSLISHTDSYSPGTDNLIYLLGTLATSQGKTYDLHQHTTPGAPLGWNWGANPTAWMDIETAIQPLINTADPNYGTYDVMVITEAINVHSFYDWWWAGSYSRKFYNAAIAANPNTRLFMYESWQHFQASDDEFRGYYGPMVSFDWSSYMTGIRTIWEAIVDEASDPAMTQNDPDYVYQGPGTDPGLGNDILPINVIPTGEVLVNVLARLAADLATDDWTYEGGELSPLDFFANPLSDFPNDLTTTIHPADQLDDIHPTNVLIYLNGLVHYAVIYQDNPIALPANNGVPSNIADIFKEVVWSTVINNPRTGVSGTLAVEYQEAFQARLSDQEVLLSWSTGIEINNDYFVIERSSSGLEWQELGIIDSKYKHSSLVNTYKAIDQSPLLGLSYYRLKQVDLDGKFSYSKIKSISLKNQAFTIYPNPSNNRLHINSNINSNYSIINSTGKTIMEGSEVDIDISKLEKGLYFIKIKNMVHKWIKN